MRNWARLHQSVDLNQDHIYYGLRTQYKQIKKRAERQYRNDILSKMAERQHKEPRQWWTLLRKLNYDRESRQLPTEVSIKMWADHFRNLLKAKPNNDCVYRQENETQLLSEERKKDIKQIYWEHAKKIDKDEVDRAIRRLKHHKATYLDSIPNEAITILHRAQPNLLIHLFNAIFLSGYFPEEWSKAYLSPLHKRGDRLNPANYRGIAISSCLGKTFNSIMNNRMENVMSDWGIQNDLQIGFERGHSIADHLFVLMTLIDQARICGQEIYLAFIDMKQAYDRVNRTKLFRKLTEYQIPAKIIRIIMDPYDNIQYCVVTDEGRSDFFTTSQGLKQGDPFSSRLFNLFIMDVIQIFDLDSEPLYLQGHAIYILCFADALLLLAAGIEGLQRSLDKLAHYCDVWGLEINISKTKAMQVSKPGKKLDPLGTPTLILNNDTVEWVTSFSYLGVEVTNRGNLQTATAPMKAKATRAQFKLSKLVRSLSFDTKIWLHQTMVDPILLHGAEVWIAQNRASLVRKYGTYKTYGDQGVKPIPGEKTKRLFVRTQMGAPRYALVIGIRGDSGEFPLYLEGLARALKYKSKIDTKDNESLLGLARRTQEDMAEHQEDCWLSTLRAVEQEITLVNAGKAVADKTEMITVMKDDYKRQWRKTLKTIANS